MLFTRSPGGLALVAKQCRSATLQVFVAQAPRIRLDPDQRTFTKVRHNEHEIQKSRLEIGMDSQEGSISARLAHLESAIDGFRHKLELHGLFSADHKVTEAELLERLEALRKRAAMSKDHQEAQSQASALEAALNRWISGTDLEFKP